jgi:large subunit ribosomal protein L21
MSYAIIRTGGKQFRAEPGKTLRIPRCWVMPVRPSVQRRAAWLKLLILRTNSDAHRCPGDGRDRQHGDDKIIVFKFKRRRIAAGHRQKFTEVRIKDITLG